MKHLSADTNNTLKIFAVLCLAGIWLMLERYLGFVQDGILYSMLSLFKLYPENFKNDLFVAYGAQDTFTIFTTLYAKIVSLTDVNLGAFIITAIGQILWLVAIFLLIRRLTHGWGTIAGLACLVYFSRYYDPIGVFSYAEPFPTPRSISEAFTLLAFSQLLDRRYLYSLLFMMAGTAFHPLMSLYGNVLWLVFFCSDSDVARKFRMELLAVILLTSAILVGFKIGPFAGFFHSYDDKWFHIFRITSGFSAFLWLWTFPQILRLVYFVLILGIAWWRNIPVLGRRIPLIIGCELALIGFWAIGTTLWHDQLLMQLQIWRSAWLVQVLALIVQGVVLLDLWQSGAAGRWLAGFLLASLVQLGYARQGGTYAVCLVISGIAIYFFLKRLSTDRLKSLLWQYLPILIPIPQLLSNAARAWPVRTFIISRASRQDWENFLLWAVLGGILAVVGWMIRRGLYRKTSLRLLFGATAGAAFLGGSMFVWSNPYLNNSNGLNAEQQTLIRDLQAYIPSDAVVFGNNGLMWSWFILHRSYYVSSQQTANSVFTRGVALEGYRRQMNICAAEVPGCLMSGFEDQSGVAPDIFWQKHAPILCRDPALDFVILSDIELSGSRIFRASPNGQPTSVFACRPYHVGPGRLPAENKESVTGSK